MRGLLLILASACYAQTFYGGYVSGAPSTTPKPSGGAFVAVQASSAAEVYSFNQFDVTMAKRGAWCAQSECLVNSERSGIATEMKDLGIGKLWAFGTAGAASNGSSTTGAFAGGGFITIEIKKSGWYIIPGIQVLQAAAAGGTTRIAFLAIGRMGKK